MIKFGDINLSEWENIITALRTLFGDVEWLDETKTLITFDKLFTLFQWRYSFRYLRAQTKEEWFNYFQLKLVEYLPDLLAKQSYLKENNLSYLVNKEQRGSYNNTTNTSGISNIPSTANENETPDINLTAGDSINTKQKVNNFVDNYNYIKNIKELNATTFYTNVNNFLDMFANLFVTYESFSYNI